MPDKLCLEMWSWYAVDEFKPVLQVCELATAVKFLGQPAEQQSASIPYCPACETWSEMMLPINDFLCSFTEPIADVLRSHLERLWELCNALDGSAFRCDDFEIFKDAQWVPLHAEAAVTLDIMGWEFLEPHVDDVMLKSRRELYPSAFKPRL
jgi:hypothetical protein